MLLGGSFHHTTQNSGKFNICELFISVILHLIFLDYSWLQKAKLWESEYYWILGEHMHTNKEVNFHLLNF